MQKDTLPSKHSQYLKLKRKGLKEQGICIVCYKNTTSYCTRLSRRYAQCNKCREANINRIQLWKDNNKTIYLNRLKEWRSKHPKYLKNWYSFNILRMKLYGAIYRRLKRRLSHDQSR